MAACSRADGAIVLFFVRFGLILPIDVDILDDDNPVISSIRRTHVDRKRMYYVRECQSTRIVTACA